MSRDLLPCGTPAAYERHYSRGETPCEECRIAWSLRYGKTPRAKRWDPAEVAIVAKIAHVRGESMAEQVAREFDCSLKQARSQIARARKLDKTVPYQLGRNTPVVDPKGNARIGVSEIILQCAECGWTTDNATAMVWHARSVHNRQATVAERTPKVSL